MDSIDPRFSFEVTDHPSNVVAVSMVTEKCDHEYITRASDDITFSPAVHDEDGRVLVSAEESRVQKRDNISSNQYPNIESNFHEYQALCNRNPDSINKNVDAGLADQLDQSSYFGATSAISTKPGLKEARNNPEAFQRHGIHRRLQFEEASNTLITRPAQSPFDSGGPEPPLETPCTPIKGKETEKIQPLYPSSMNSTVNVPKPSGIGLHLNSIVNVLPSGSGAVVRVKSAQNCHFSIRGKKSIHTINSPLFDRSPVSAVLNPAENESEWVDDNGTEVHASTADKSFTSLSIVSIKSSNNSVDNQSAQGNRSEYTKIETDGNPEEFKTNTDKKRKRSSDSGGGCKRCHCKKSKCLKLYCDCFAAGLYCAGSCACQGCYNRPEYENMVLESRQQIESRNPLAFAPKIVEHVVEPPASIYEENESNFIPSLARHKRGCSCKKSMCLKKYCECYHKSNVGCSDGCRCEGCQNVYGQKPESTLDKDFLSKESTTERADGSLAGRTSYVNGGLCHSELTPRTPSIQLFKKDVPQGCLRPRQCFQSPGSSDTLLTPNAMIPWSPTNSDNNTIVSKTAVEVVDLSSPPRELCYDISETPNKFLTVVHQTGNLPSLLDSEERTNHLKVQSFTGNDRPSSAGSTRYLKAVDLDGDLSNAIQDDTPDILKDCPAPLSAVKSSSPNKKRVSPPHAPRHEHGLRSLNGLRSGRKFILKAVPSTPPLIPPSVGSVRAVPRETDGPP